jgi:hypothetical protein
MVTQVVIETLYKSTFPTRSQRAVPRGVTRVQKRWETEQKRGGFPNSRGLFPNFSGEFPNLFPSACQRSRCQGSQPTVVPQQIAQTGPQDGLRILGGAMCPDFQADAVIQHQILVGNPDKVCVRQLLCEPPHLIGASLMACHKQDAEALQLAAPFRFVAAISVAGLVGLIVHDLGAQVVGAVGGARRRLTAHIDFQEEEQVLVLLLAADTHHGIRDKAPGPARHRSLSRDPGTLFISGQQGRSGREEVTAEAIAATGQSCVRYLTPVLQQLMGHHARRHGPESVIGDGAFDQAAEAQGLDTGHVERKYKRRPSGGPPHGSDQLLYTCQLSELFQSPAHALFSQAVQAGQLCYGQNSVLGHGLQQVALLGRETESLHQITSWQVVVEGCDEAAANPLGFRGTYAGHHPLSTQHQGGTS